MGRSVVRRAGVRGLLLPRAVAAEHAAALRPTGILLLRRVLFGLLADRIGVALVRRIPSAVAAVDRGIRATGARARLVGVRVDRRLTGAVVGVRVDRRLTGVAVGVRVDRRLTGVAVGVRVDRRLGRRCGVFRADLVVDGAIHVLRTTGIGVLGTCVGWRRARVGVPVDVQDRRHVGLRRWRRVHDVSGVLSGRRRCIGVRRCGGELGVRAGVRGFTRRAGVVLPRVVLAVAAVVLAVAAVVLAVAAVVLAVAAVVLAVAAVVLAVAAVVLAVAAVVLAVAAVVLAVAAVVLAVAAVVLAVAAVVLAVAAVVLAVAAVVLAVAAVVLAVAAVVLAVAAVVLAVAAVVLAVAAVVLAVAVVVLAVAVVVLAVAVVVLAVAVVVLAVAVVVLAVAVVVLAVAVVVLAVAVVVLAVAVVVLAVAAVVLAVAAVVLAVAAVVLVLAAGRIAALVVRRSLLRCGLVVRAGVRRIPTGRLVGLAVGRRRILRGAAVTAGFGVRRRRVGTGLPAVAGAAGVPDVTHRFGVGLEEVLDAVREVAEILEAVRVDLRPRLAVGGATSVAAAAAAAATTFEPAEHSGGEGVRVGSFLFFALVAALRIAAELLPGHVSGEFGEPLPGGVRGGLNGPRRAGVHELLRLLAEFGERLGRVRHVRGGDVIHVLGAALGSALRAPLARDRGDVVGVLARSLADAVADLLAGLVADDVRAVLDDPAGEERTAALDDAADRAARGAADRAADRGALGEVLVPLGALTGEHLHALDHRVQAHLDGCTDHRARRDVHQHLGDDPPDHPARRSRRRGHERLPDPRNPGHRERGGQHDQLDDDHDSGVLDVRCGVAGQIAVAPGVVPQLGHHRQHGVPRVVRVRRGELAAHAFAQPVHGLSESVVQTFDGISDR
ncbi:hypothetical protein [Saccharopolyspora gloriosae]|uniref:hypothetical protein n=1 Tax=Saccharopolyspora gloriosae TaxID=455344 RepID=UPI001FB76615|nr:hypothetical protein [Saccharopolyspora gloriosae]